MRGYSLEVVLWGAFAASLAVTFGLLQLQGPRWAVNLSLGTAFATSIPIMVLTLRKQWRGG